MMKRLLILSLCLTWTSSAQEAPSKNVRFLPLGELPPFKQIIGTDRRKQGEYPKGSMPPEGTVLMTEPGEGTPLGLRLKTFTKSLKIKASAKGVEIYEGGKVAGEPWFKSRFPAQKQALFVLCKDNATMTWDKPQVKVLPEDVRSFPLGTIRLANLSDRGVAVILGDEKAFAVKAGEVILKPMKAGEVLVKLAVKDASGAWRTILQNNLTMSKKGRMHAFFYKAQTKDAKKTPVKFFSKLEGV